MLTEFYFALHHMSDGSKVLSLDFEAMLRALPAPLECEWKLLRVPHPSDYPDGSAFVPGPALRMPPPDEMEMVRRCAEAAQSHVTLPAVPIELNCDTELDLEIDMPDAPPLTPTPSESGADDARDARNGAVTPERDRRTRISHSQSTDDKIRELVALHGPKWRNISAALGGRLAGWSDDVCRNRYLRISGADRRVSRAPTKPREAREDWSASEDAALQEAIRVLKGAKIPWIRICDAANLNRTPHAIRNRSNRMGWTRDHHST